MCVGSLMESNPEARRRHCSFDRAIATSFFEITCLPIERAVAVELDRDAGVGDQVA